MDTLLFIRHAETDLSGRFCGHSDPPVNKRGRRQIEALLKTLNTESIDAVYTSNLSRAFTTADAIGRSIGLSPITVPGLREIDFGEWEGLCWKEIESRDQSYARRWSEAYPSLPAPGGEEFDNFQSRVLSEIDHLLAQRTGKSAAVITHAGVMRVVLRSLCGLDEASTWERTKVYCCSFRYERGNLL